MQTSYRLQAVQRRKQIHMVYSRKKSMSSKWQPMARPRHQVLEPRSPRLPRYLPRNLPRPLLLGGWLYLSSSSSSLESIPLLPGVSKGNQEGVPRTVRGQRSEDLRKAKGCVSWAHLPVARRFLLELLLLPPA